MDAMTLHTFDRLCVESKGVGRLGGCSLNKINRAELKGRGLHNEVIFTVSNRMKGRQGCGPSSWVAVWVTYCPGGLYGGAKEDDLVST